MRARPQCATRLGLCEGFAADLTAARANGTLWDLSLEDDRVELRRVQNREQSELLAGSPPGDGFSSLLNTCVESQEISKLTTERIEPQIRACVQAYKLQMETQKNFVHEHPKDSTSWEMPEVQSLVSDPEVHSIDGPVCRWSLKARGSNDEVEFMRKRQETRSHDWKVRNSVRVSCITCGCNVECYRMPDDFRWCDQSW